MPMPAKRNRQTRMSKSNKVDEPAGNASFWDHLEVLRWTLMRSVVAVVVAVVAVFPAVPWLFDHVVMAPCNTNFFLYRMLDAIDGVSAVMPDELAQPFQVSIININLASQFFLHINLAFWLGFIVCVPYLLFELWRFVAPALYANEKGKMRFTLVFGMLMFYVGCCVGYGLVFPLTLRFLYTYQLSAAVSNELSLTSYMDNFLTLVFTMGIVFELPLVSLFLSKIGLLRRRFFSTYRRHAIVVLMVVSAFITPSSDPFTMLAVFLPIYALWELSALLVKR